MYSYQAPSKHHQVVKHQPKHHNNHQPIVNNSTTPPVKNNTTVTPPPIIVNNTTTPPPVVNNTTVTPPPVIVPSGANFIVNNGQSIQNAINSAKAGDLVIVNPGTYSGFSINKGVSVVANGTVNIGEVSITASNVKIQGFRITGDYAITLHGVNNIQILDNLITSLYNGISDTGTNSNITVKGNTLVGTNPTYGNNIAFEGVTSNSNIINNHLSGAQYGILFDVASTQNIISGNTVIGGNDVISDPAVG